MEKSKEERIKQIDERIKELEEHMTMWRKAGGVGGNMALTASSEINKLRQEKEDILSGKDVERISKIQLEISRLMLAREKAIIFKKRKYDSEIKELESELQSLQNNPVRK